MKQLKDQMSNPLRVKGSFAATYPLVTVPSMPFHVESARAKLWSAIYLKTGRPRMRVPSG